MIVNCIGNWPNKAISTHILALHILCSWYLACPCIAGYRPTKLFIYFFCRASRICCILSISTQKYIHDVSHYIHVLTFCFEFVFQVCSSFFLRSLLCSNRPHTVHQSKVMERLNLSHGRFTSKNSQLYSS